MNERLRRRTAGNGSRKFHVFAVHEFGLVTVLSVMILADISVKGNCCVVDDLQRFNSVLRLTWIRCARLLIKKMKDNKKWIATNGNFGICERAPASQMKCLLFQLQLDFLNYHIHCVPFHAKLSVVFPCEKCMMNWWLPNLFVCLEFCFIFLSGGSGSLRNISPGDAILFKSYDENKRLGKSKW